MNTFSGKLKSYFIYLWQTRKREQRDKSWSYYLKRLIGGWYSFVFVLFIVALVQTRFNIISYDSQLWQWIMLPIWTTFLATMLICTVAIFVGLVSAVVLPPLPVVREPTKKELRQMALRDHVSKAGGNDIHVKRVGVAGTYLEHFLINYRDSENQWQVRHVIRNQMKEQYYWDDPVVTYEREVSAEISQSKQQLINDLDVEIHKLRHALQVEQHRQSLP